MWAKHTNRERPALLDLKATVTLVKGDPEETRKAVSGKLANNLLSILVFTLL